MNFDTLLLSLQDKLPKNDTMAIITLKEKFEKLNDSKKQEVVTKIPLLNLKSPALVFWVGNVLFGMFGVARFMIGDKVLGSVRLLLTLTVIGMLVSIPWTIVDLFLVGKKLRRQNFEKVTQTIDLVVTTTQTTKATQDTQITQQVAQGVTNKKFQSVDREDIIAKIGWALYDSSLIYAKLEKLSSEQLNIFAERVDELDLKDHTRVWLWTLFFGALGVARFMTGYKVAGWIRLSLPILWVIVLASAFLVPKESFAAFAIVHLVKIAILFCLKIAIIALWVWDIYRVGSLVESYNFYQIMDLIQEIEAGEEK